MLSDKLINSICQVLMLSVLTAEFYLIRHMRKYSKTKIYQWLSMVFASLQLIAFVVMLERNGDNAAKIPHGAIEDFFNIFTLVSVIAIVYVFLKFVEWRKNQLSVGTIKEGLDDLPVGICFYEISGRPLLLNNTINQISESLFGEKVNNGNEFWENVMACNKSDNGEYALVSSAGGRVFMFKKEFFGGTTEITATDVSEPYILSAQLKTKVDNLNAYNRRLKEYGNKIGELTKDKEILAVKVKIHDNTGRLLLLCRRSISEPENMKFRTEALIALRTENELLSARESSDNDDMFAKIKKVAHDIGVNIEYRGKLPEVEDEKEKILINAIHECLTNTVSHAGGDELYVRFENYDNLLVMECRNNGNKPEAEIQEGGGLSSLRKRVEDYGGRMMIVAVPEFILRIEFENLQ